MAVPKKKISKQRKHKRRGEHKAVAATLVKCPRCGDPKIPHRVCPTCGTYRGVQVLEVADDV